MDNSQLTIDNFILHKIQKEVIQTDSLLCCFNYQLSLYLMGLASTPSCVILTGLIKPFSSKVIFSIQVTR